MASARWVAIALAAATAVRAAKWVENQVNTTMCKWGLPRVGVIRDTAYIDGGWLYWQPGLSNGGLAAAEADPVNSGLVYTLNFSVPFKFSDNISAILEASAESYAPGGGALNNYFPTYVDGTLFANDGQFIEYGGMPEFTSKYTDDPPDEVLVYQESWYGAEGKDFAQGFLKKKLEGNVTRYVTSGGAVSVPSENKGFYFSGTRSNGSAAGPIYHSLNDGSDVSPGKLSDTLVTLDMALQQDEKFTNDTLPPDIPARAGSELAFVPVGEQGALVAIGGVTEPFWDFNLFGKMTADQIASSAQKSPEFLSRVAIYDIKNKKWYTQLTSSPPTTALAQGCAVVATAGDQSSHNIYWYGGTDGLTIDQPYSDAVWVLSLPSFTWKQLSAGDNAKHGRSGHRCVKPYPDQMLVIGGDTPAQGNSLTCLTDTDGKAGGGMIQGFNLSSGEWMTEYSPEKWFEYQVPSAIFATIGGNAEGGATVLSPAQWDDPELEALFATTYDTSKIKSYYPYAVAAADPNTTRPNVDPPPSTNSNSGSGTPKWLAPVLGTVLGLVFLSALIVIILLFRRRRFLRSTQSETDGTSEAQRGRILSWVKGSAGDPKSPTTLSATASDYNNSGTDLTSSGRTRAFSSTSNATTDRAMSPLGHEVNPVEAGGEVIHEMPDTSAIQELSATNTGMAYIAPTTQKAGLARNTSVQSQSTEGGFLSPASEGTGTWHSGSTHGTGAWDASSPIISPSTPRPDSPTEGSGGGVFGHRASGSAGSKPEMREISREILPGEGTGPSISPPTPKREGSDYLSARSVTPSTQRRKSAFGEHFDEKS